MQPFVYALIRQYDEYFQNYIIFNCKCYKDSFNKSNFWDDLKQKTYACCIGITVPMDTVVRNGTTAAAAAANENSSDQPTPMSEMSTTKGARARAKSKRNKSTVQFQTKLYHQALPIMLGSSIDRHIRKVNQVKFVEHTFNGAYILDGTIMILPNFLTNNLSVGHVRKVPTGSSKSLSKFKLIYRNTLLIPINAGLGATPAMRQPNTSAGFVVDGVDADIDAHRIVAVENVVGVPGPATGAGRNGLTANQRRRLGVAVATAAKFDINGTTAAVAATAATQAGSGRRVGGVVEVDTTKASTNSAAAARVGDQNANVEKLLGTVGTNTAGTAFHGLCGAAAEIGQLREGSSTQAVPQQLNQLKKYTTHYYNQMHSIDYDSVTGKFTWSMPESIASSTSGTLFDLDNDQQHYADTVVRRGEGYTILKDEVSRSGSIDNSAHDAVINNKNQSLGCTRKRKLQNSTATNERLQCATKKSKPSVFCSDSRDSSHTDDGSECCDRSQGVRTPPVAISSGGDGDEYEVDNSEPEFTDYYDDDEEAEEEEGDDDEDDVAVTLTEAAYEETGELEDDDDDDGDDDFVELTAEGQTANNEIANSDDDADEIFDDGDNLSEATTSPVPRIVADIAKKTTTTNKSSNSRRGAVNASTVTSTTIPRQWFDSWLCQRRKHFGWHTFPDQTNRPDNGITVAAYKLFIDACIANAPQLDQISNKMCITGPEILKRALDYIQILHMYRFSPQTIRSRMQSMLIKGNLYFTLSKKPIGLGKAYNIKQNIFQAVDAQKLNLVSYLVGTTKRKVSEQMRNSNALKFPDDAFYFVDGVNVREMKGAGETVYLSDFVLPALKVDLVKLYEQLRPHLVLGNPELDLSTAVSGDGDHDRLKHLAVNGYPTGYMVSKRALLQVKFTTPFVHVHCLGDNYFHVTTKGGVLMRYSSKYNTFLAPNEYSQLLPDAFNDYPLYAAFSPLMGFLPSSFYKAQPSKLVVVMSNIKGRCNVIRNSFELNANVASVGNNNTIIIHNKKLLGLTESSTLTVFSGSNRATARHNHGDEYAPRTVRLDVPKLTTAYQHRKYRELAHLEKHATLADALLARHASTTVSGGGSVACCSHSDSLIVDTLNALTGLDSDGSEQGGCQLANLDSYKQCLAAFVQQLENYYTSLQSGYYCITLESSTGRKVEVGTAADTWINDDDDDENDTRDGGQQLTYRDYLALRRDTMTGIDDDWLTLNLSMYPRYGEHWKFLMDTYLRPADAAKLNVNQVSGPPGDWASAEVAQLNAEALSKPIILDKRKVRLHNNVQSLEIFKGQGVDVDPIVSQAHFIAYCAIGDVSGSTNEDGIVIDQRLVAEGPRIMNLITIRLPFSIISTSGPNAGDSGSIGGCGQNNMTTISYQAVDQVANNVVMVGILDSSQALQFIKKNLIVDYVYIGKSNIHRYKLKYIDAHNYARTVVSAFDRQSNEVFVNITYQKPITVGTKLSNLHGQKGIISKIVDLSNTRAYRRDGTVVHPQILFSPTSILGRLVASQIYEMLTSPELAVTETGAFVAPLAFNIHHIESSIKARRGIMKNDLMTVENGFIANNMPSTSEALMCQGPINRKDSFHLTKQLQLFNGIEINTNI